MRIPNFPRRHQMYRRNWAQFFRRTVPDAAWQGVARQGPAARRSDLRWTLPYLLQAWLIIGWSVQTTLADRMKEAYQWLAHRFPARRRPGHTYNGLLKASLRAGPDLFRTFWRQVRPSAARRLGRARSWHGWTVLAADGSRLDAPRTRANARRLGRAGRDHTGPQWWVTWLVHLPTRMVWDWRQGKGTSSERRHLQEMIADLPPDTLLVADAGYVGFDLMTRLIDARVDFLIRCGSNVRLLLADAVQSLEGTRVYLWPQGRRHRPPLALRLIVLKRRGRRVYLLTDVLDPARLSRRMAGEIYQARWGVEVQFRGLKCTLKHHRVLAKTPEAGAVELAAYVLALALLMLEGAVALGRQVVRLSVAAALRAWREALEALRTGTWAPPVATALRAAVRDAYSRHRPKRSRYWPRKKNDHPPGPPQFQRLTPLQIARIQWVLSRSTTT
jgi:Transposase DDE domain